MAGSDSKNVYKVDPDSGAAVQFWPSGLTWFPGYENSIGGTGFSVRDGDFYKFNMESYGKNKKIVHFSVGTTELSEILSYAIDVDVEGIDYDRGANRWYLATDTGGAYINIYDDTFQNLLMQYSVDGAVGVLVEDQYVWTVNPDSKKINRYAKNDMSAAGTISISYKYPIGIASDGTNYYCTLAPEGKILKFSVP